MRAGLAGDRRAYERALERLSQLVRERARAELARMGCGNADTEDVVQETLLAIHLKRHTWDPRLPILPWVHAITRHKSLDHARRHFRRAASSLDIDGMADRLAAPEPEASLSATEIDRLLGELPASQREVVRALTVEGSEVREVAARLGKREGTVRVILHRGLAALSRLCQSSEARTAAPAITPPARPCDPDGEETA